MKAGLENASAQLTAAKHNIDKIREEISGNEQLDRLSTNIRYEIERIDTILQLLNATAPRKLNPVA